MNHTWKIPSQWRVQKCLTTAGQHTLPSWCVKLTIPAGIYFLPSRTSVGREQSSFSRQHTRHWVPTAIGHEAGGTQVAGNWGKCKSWEGRQSWLFRGVLKVSSFVPREISLQTTSALLSEPQGWKSTQCHTREKEFNVIYTLKCSDLEWIIP